MTLEEIIIELNKELFTLRKEHKSQRENLERMAEHWREEENKHNALKESVKYLKKA